MSSGIPVIATNVGDVNGLVRNSITGYVIDKCASDKLFASKIIELSENRALCNTMGINARRTIIENHSIGTCIDNLINVYSKLL
jgi:glycosyltransferase involved in cell wall biosynthesis